MRLLLLASLLVCLAGQIGCRPTTESAVEAAPEPDHRLSDSDLKNRIGKQLKSDADLNRANLSVEVDAKRDWVTLSGTVGTESLRTRAIEMARAAHPGLTVDDRIEVKPPAVKRSEYTPEMARDEVDRALARGETVGGSLDDAWIHAKIVAHLIADTATPERLINVDVEGRVVTLRGTVETAEQKREAQRVARQTQGVRRVNDLLAVAKN